MIEKFRVAFRGLMAGARDKSVRLQLLLGVLTIVVFYIMGISYMEWLVVLLTIGIVVSVEMLNTCIERLCDLYSEEVNSKIRYIKDLSSAAVLFFCIMAAIVALMIILNNFGG